MRWRRSLQASPPMLRAASGPEKSGVGMPSALVRYGQVALSPRTGRCYPCAAPGWPGIEHLGG